MDEVVGPDVVGVRGLHRYALPRPATALPGLREPGLPPQTLHPLVVDPKPLPTQERPCRPAAGSRVLSGDHPQVGLQLLVPFPDDPPVAVPRDIPASWQLRRSDTCNSTIAWT